MKALKWILSLIGIGVGLYLVYLTFVAFAISAPILATSSKAELVDNYKLREKEIFELKQYFNSIVPDSFWVYLEFKDDKTIDLWVFEKDRYSNSHGSAIFRQWDIDPYHYTEKPTPFDSLAYAPKTKSLDLVKNKLKWNDQTFIEIKKMLDNANCISIDNDEPTEIGFARSGMGKYFYTVFTDPIPKSERDTYNDSCTYILYNERVALQYGGGAFGPQCFPD